MKNAVTTEQSMPVVQGNATTLLTAIAAAASNPAADIDKMERLFAMHEQMIKREAEMAFNAAFSRAQAKMPIVATNAVNSQTNSRYAKLAAIVEAISPIYTNEGFSVSFNNADSPIAGNIRVLAKLSHPAGHSRDYQIDMPPDDVGIKGTANKTKVHAAGSTNAYARRYLTLMIWNLTTEDDTDGNRSRVTPNAGAGDELDEETRDRIKALAIKVAKWFETDSVGDAYAEIDNTTLDVDEKRYLWSLLDSKQRTALTEEGKAVRAKHSPKRITDSQRKRLEARINELGLNRDTVKSHMKILFDKDHFPDLTMPEYERLDSELELIPHTTPPAEAGQG